MVKFWCRETVGRVISGGLNSRARRQGVVFIACNTVLVVILSDRGPRRAPYLREVGWEAKDLLF